MNNEFQKGDLVQAILGGKQQYGFVMEVGMKTRWRPEHEIQNPYIKDHWANGQEYEYFEDAAESFGIKLIKKANENSKI